MANKKLNILLKIFALILSILMVGFLYSFYIGLSHFIWIVLPWIVIPVFLGFVATSLMTIIIWIKAGYKSNRLIINSHIAVLILALITYVYFSEFFKSQKVFYAVLYDDLGGIELVLRENGKFEMTPTYLSIAGDKICGKYLIHSDTLIFSKDPYLNEMIPRKIFIDREREKIYFKKDKDGFYVREDNFAEYFEIISNDI